MTIKLQFPLQEEVKLSLFDEIEISGRIFCGRDAALPQLVRLYQEGRLAEFGLDLRGSLIFHTAVSGAGIGPTSSNKLDIEQSIPLLSEAGVKIHLGKGALKAETIAAMARNNSYYAVTPPVSALFSSCIISKRIAAFAHEGMEALWELEVAGLPAVIADAQGEAFFEPR